MSGKGKGPEKGRNHAKFREGYAGIRWGKKVDPPAILLAQRKKS